MDDREALNLTQRELLIRIDERQSTMRAEFAEFKLIMTAKVTNDIDYQDIVKKVNVMWDWRNRVIGMVIAWSAIAGTAAAFIFSLIKDFLFKK